MQKLITVGIDLRKLPKAIGTPFSINEVEAINEMLLKGWEIQDWDFLKEDNGSGEIVLLVTLDDSMIDEDDEFDDDFSFDLDEDEDDDEDAGEDEDFDFNKDE